MRAVERAAPRAGCTRAPSSPGSVQTQYGAERLLQRRGRAGTPATPGHAPVWPDEHRPGRGEPEGVRPSFFGIGEPARTAHLGGVQVDSQAPGGRPRSLGGGHKMGASGRRGQSWGRAHSTEASRPLFTHRTSTVRRPAGIFMPRGARPRAGGAWGSRWSPGRPPDASASIAGRGSATGGHTARTAVAAGFAPLHEPPGRGRGCRCPRCNPPPRPAARWRPTRQTALQVIRPPRRGGCGAFTPREGGPHEVGPQDGPGIAALPNRGSA